MKVKILLMVAGGMLLGAGAGAGAMMMLKPAAHDQPRPEVAPAGPVGYFALQQGLTSNLRGTDQFVQLSMSVGYAGDEAFGEDLKKHETAMRAAALLVVADADAATVVTIAGKQALAARIKAAINTALKERGVPRGIDKVYFTGFVVQ